MFLKYKNRYRLLSLALIFLIFVLLAFALRLINKSTLYVNMSQISDYKSKIAEEELRIGELKNNIDSLKSELEIYTGTKESDQTLIIEYMHEIDKYKETAGFSDVYGEGIVIFVDDGGENLSDSDIDEPLNLFVHDLDVRKLINELYNAKAEAVSINNNRIVMGLSDVFCNGPTIKINGIQQSRPYVIKAIGDKYKLSRTMLNYDSYATKLMSYGVKVELISSSEIQIPAYSGKQMYNYAAFMEE